MRLAACVVLYNPDSNLEKNINSYIDHVDYLIIIDNSPLPFLNDLSFIKKEKFELINKNENVGIAKALNIAADTAASLNFQWLLTMDQDSFFDVNGVQELKDALGTLLKEQKIGIISPVHVDITKSVPEYIGKLVNETDIVMTSGNILNLLAWKDVGFFEEKLFIDGVDHDFCLRLILKGYKVIENKKAKLIHPVGNIKNLNFLGFNFHITRHNPIRVYYMSRNSYYLIFRYYKHFPKYAKSLIFRKIKNFLKILFFEENKFKKINASVSGALDFLKNKYGKYSY